MNLKVLEIEHKKENDSLLPLYKRRIGPGEKGGEQWDSSCPTHVYIPLTLTKTVQSELISDFSGIHRIWQVLLVGEHQQESITACAGVLRGPQEYVRGHSSRQRR